MLIIAMLEKDKSKRPSIWELSEIPCINSTIAQFIKKNGLKGNEYIFKELPIKKILFQQIIEIFEIRPNLESFLF